MRIIAGRYKGLKLFGPSHHGLRPTTEMVREALFNILREFDGGKVLDLFAGTGSLGIEALSRGAETVTFVEQDPRSLRLLKQNLERLRDYDISVRVIPADVFRIMPRLSREEDKFDLIFADPPYKSDLWMRVLSDINKYHLLKNEGQIVLEMPKSHKMPEKVGRLVLQDKRNYGEVSLEFWEHESVGVDKDEDSDMSGKF